MYRDSYTIKYNLYICYILYYNCYLYYEGGLYLDCKFVAIQSMNKLMLKYDEFYCLDSDITRVYNAIMYNNKNKSLYLKTYINLIISI